ncbi:RluA family pseudouridine synthase [Hyphococcus luteus]|uniref:Pseudouridine synthase n=1 Tax=Hyphococcus luteus TaxID=2058213 RepID=A0A2S7K7P6_9PROT|nr:RluA family pseudouridine synthase [Marinicaulis flavus]PQA88525.1 RNA pseudouridine synthase [Marinicaulis flavus]
MTADDETLKPGEPLKPDETGAYAFAVNADAAGARLDKWLSDNIAELTRTRLKALIEEGALEKGGEVFTDPSWKLREGERYRLVPPPLVEPAPKPEAIPLDVVYQDDDLIVVNKPAGMVVHPAPGAWTGTLVNALLHHCGDSLSGIGGARRPGVVHRIDKDTSGLLVVAKHDAAHQGLSALFSAHDIERVYEAIAVGAPRPGVGTIDAPIARKPQDRTKMTVVDTMVWDDEADDYVPKHGGRHAVTHYKVIETFGRTRAKLKGDALASLIECTLETGRTHQIRVHLSHIGCPLIGDQSYGRGPGLSGLKPGDPAADCAIETLRNFKRQALHAKVLGFKHPITGEAMRFERAGPEDFQTLLAALRAL